MKKAIITFLFAIAITGNIFGQKTSHSDCRTGLEANYERGVYIVSITNKTSTPMTYRVNFPDGSTIKSTRIVLGGETLGIQQGTTYFTLGTIVVIPIFQAPAKCPFGSVQVLLW